ncbi:hypothetical protein ABK040_012019 [Willaertia magna]
MHLFKTLKAGRNISEETSLSFPEPIKFIKSGNGFILIVNTLGELFVYDEYDLFRKNSDNDINQFKKINGINDIKLMACGYEHGIIINKINEIFIFGEYPSDPNSLQQLLDNNFFKKVTNIPNEEIKIVTCGFDNTFIVTKNNIIYVTGVNTYGQLGISDNNITCFVKVDTLQYTNIIDVQCGDDHSLVLDSLGNIYGSGDNSRNQLSLYKNSVSLFTNIAIPFKVKKISAVAQGSVLLSTTGEVYISGNVYNNHTDFKKVIMPTTDIKIENVFSTFINSHVYLFANDSKCYYHFLRHDVEFKELDYCNNNNNNIIDFTVKYFLPCYFTDTVYMLISDYSINDNVVDGKEINQFKLKLWNCNLQNKVSDAEILF